MIKSKLYLAFTIYRLLNSKHSVERDARPAGRLFGHGYLVYDAAREKRFEHPCEILRGYAVHRRAHAQVGREQTYIFIRVLLDKSIDEVHLRADGPRGTGGRFLNRLDDELGRAVHVRLLDDRALALGMHEHLDARHFLPQLI